jgi:hypothetical protein
VQEDARVADVLAAVGLLTPFELDDQVIVAVSLLGANVAEAVPGDVQQALGDAEDLARVGAPGVLEPGGQPGEVLAVEQLDGAPGENGLRLPLIAAEQGAGCQEQDTAREAANHETLLRIGATSPRR